MKSIRSAFWLCLMLAVACGVAWSWHDVVLCLVAAFVIGAIGGLPRAVYDAEVGDDKPTQQGGYQPAPGGDPGVPPRKP